MAESFDPFLVTLPLERKERTKQKETAQITKAAAE